MQSKNEEIVIDDRPISQKIISALFCSSATEKKDKNSKNQVHSAANSNQNNENNEEDEN